MTQLYAVSDATTAVAADVNQYRELFRGNFVYDVANGYGATGDGVTDDTSAIQAAIAAAAANGTGGVVFFPSGTYITSPLTIPPGVLLKGVSGQGYYNATTTVPNANTISRLRLKAGSSSALISPDDTGTTLSTHVRLTDLALDCAGQSQPAINIADSGFSISRFWRFERCYIVDVGGTPGSGSYATYIGNQNTAIVMRDCVWFNGTSGARAGGDAVGWYGSDGFMSNCYIGYWGGVGLTVLGGANDETFVMSGGGIFTCTTGVVTAGYGAVFVGVSIDHHYNDGAYVGYGPSTFIGCAFHTNSRTADGTWSDIYVNSANIQVNVIGCRREANGGESAFKTKHFINVNQTGVVLNQFGNFANPGVTFGTSIINYSGAVTAPAFPSSTVAVQNTTGGDVQAFIANGVGAITAITLGTTVTGMTIAANGTAVIRIPHGQTIKFTYGSGSPAWTWVIG